MPKTRKDKSEHDCINHCSGIQHKSVVGFQVLHYRLEIPELHMRQHVSILR